MNNSEKKGWQNDKERLFNLVKDELEREIIKILSIVYDPKQYEQASFEIFKNKYSLFLTLCQKKEKFCNLLPSSIFLNDAEKNELENFGVRYLTGPLHDKTLPNYIKERRVNHNRILFWLKFSEMQFGCDFSSVIVEINYPFFILKIPLNGTYEARVIDILREAYFRMGLQELSLTDEDNHFVLKFKDTCYSELRSNNWRVGY